MRTTASRRRDEYTNNDYHKVSDEIKPDWISPEQLTMDSCLTTIGFRVAQGEKYPEWKTGSEFKSEA